VIYLSPEKSLKEAFIMSTNLTAHATMILSWALGYLGADRFYRGDVALGVIKLLTVGGAGIWYLIDAIYFTYKAGQTAQWK
jgi:TM2 domain-containing membrane protein YozV